MDFAEGVHLPAAGLRILGLRRTSFAEGAEMSLGQVNSKRMMSALLDAAPIKSGGRRQQPAFLARAAKTYHSIVGRSRGSQARARWNGYLHGYSSGDTTPGSECPRDHGPRRGKRWRVRRSVVRAAMSNGPEPDATGSDQVTSHLSEHTRHSRAFSLVELLVVIGIIAIVTALILPVLARTRRAAEAVNCLSNLRQIGLAFNQFAFDRNGRLPDPSAADTSWERSLKAYLPASEVFRCPGDGEVSPSVGSSYDWRDTGDPDTTLAGKTTTEVKRSDIALAYDALPGWHAKQMVNVVLLDGAALAMSQDDWIADLAKPILAK